MNTDTGGPEADAVQDADEQDREVFRRLGVMTIVWVLLLILAGTVLILFGGVLTDLLI